MAYQKTITNHITDDSLLAGADKGGRLLTAADGETFTPGNALTVDADNNVVDSGVAATGDVSVAKAGTLIGTRGRINFIEGTNITLTIADDSGNDEVDVTIDSSGGGGGGGTYSSILDSVMDWYVANNADDMDHKIADGDFVALIHHQLNSTSGFISPSVALHTVATGKKAVLLRVAPTNAVIADVTFRGMRLRNTTDSVDIVAQVHFNARAADVPDSESDSAGGGKLPEVAAGKAIELQTWNSSANARRRGGFVILKEIAV